MIFKPKIDFFFLLISDTIHAGANLMLMCAQINSTIDQEQNKTLWVPSGTIW